MIRTTDMGGALLERRGPYPIGLMAIIATVAMLFASFTAAILVRRTGMDWVRVSLPAIVWLNTAIIVVSSVVIELGRAAVRKNEQLRAARLLEVTALLGGLFIVIGAATSGGEEPGVVGGVFFLMGLLFALGGIFYSLLGGRAITVAYIDDMKQHAWLKGAHPDFLAGLPQWGGPSH